MEHIKEWLNSYETIKICIKDPGAAIMEIYPNKIETEADYLHFYVGNVLNHSAMCALDASKYNVEFKQKNRVMEFSNEDSGRTVKFIGF